MITIIIILCDQHKPTNALILRVLCEIYMSNLCISRKCVCVCAPAHTCV